MYVDVVLPVRLAALTYRVPDSALYDLAGRIVKVPLQGRMTYGLAMAVLQQPEESPSFTGRRGGIRDLDQVGDRYLSGPSLELLRWLSDYYLTPPGIALKSMFFEEAARVLQDHAAGGSPTAPTGCRRRAAAYEMTAKGLSGQSGISVTDCDLFSPPLSTLRHALGQRRYGTFLLHAPSSVGERGFAKDIMTVAKSQRGIIVLVPEIGHLSALTPVLKGIFGERLAVLHSRLSKGRRCEAIARIISGSSDVVAGTRSAVLAPLREVSLIAVLGEHSSSYKAEEGLRYSGRDVAVMRGFVERSLVLLSSVCPSVDSVHNARTGKYALLSADVPTARPRVIVVDRRTSKRDTGVLSHQVIKKTRELISRSHRVLFLMNRKGYSFIRCRDCEQLLACPSCLIPLIYYRGRAMMACSRCHREEHVPEVCPSCKGYSLAPMGAGTERIRDELTKTLGSDAMIIERSGPAKRVAVEPETDITPLVVGTAHATRSVGADRFGAAVFVSFDQILSQPSFRAYERAFQDVLEASQAVRDDGVIFLQTWSARNRIAQYVSRYDFSGFYDYELRQRRELSYPPFSRMILVTFTIAGVKEGVIDRVAAIGLETAEASVEVLGPIETPDASSTKGARYQILLKGADRKALHRVGGCLVAALRQLKGLDVVVDVDPLRI